jgi:hypothetical protein
MRVPLPAAKTIIFTGAHVTGKPPAASVIISGCHAGALPAPAAFPAAGGAGKPPGIHPFPLIKKIIIRMKILLEGLLKLCEVAS